MDLLSSLQFYWFVGHAVTLFSTIAYFLMYITFESSSRAAEIAYRMHFLGVGLAYGLVLYKARALRRAKLGNSDRLGLWLQDENVHHIRECYTYC